MYWPTGMQYDPEGRMIWSANLDGSNPATSVYDGLGQRVQTTQAGVTKRYFYDVNGSVVAEYEATGGTGYGALKRLTVCAAGRLLAVDEVQPDFTKVTSYVMADRQGSTRVLMNAAGAVTSRHDYLPFGEEIGAGTGAPGSPTGMRTTAKGYSAADNVRQRYADTRLDDATGLDHTLWRKLETRSGRWTTPDPYGKSLRVSNPQSFNRYAYVHNDPVNSKDPSGLDVCYPDPATGQTVCIPEIDAGTVTIGFGQTSISSGVGGMMGGDTGMRLVDPSPDGTSAGGIEPQNPEPQFDWPLFWDLLAAATALQRQSCRDLFGSNVDPSKLLGNLAAGNAGLGTITRGDLGAPSSGSVTAANTTGILGSRTVSRPDGTTFQQSTFTGANIVLNSNAAAPFQSGYRDYLGVGASDSTYRAITLIHELGHAAGIIYGANASKILDDQDNSAQSRANSKLVYD